MFYVYLLYRASDRSVVYVGKGNGARSDWHNRAGAQHTNPMLRGMYAKDGPFIVEHVFETLNENEAHARERFLISLYGRRDLRRGTLANLTDGGEGTSGRPHSADTRAKISDVKRARFIEREGRSGSTRIATPGRKPGGSQGRLWADDTRSKLSAAAMGNKGRSGQKISDETKAKMSEARRLYWATRT